MSIVNEIQKKVLPVFQPYGVTRAGIFGSLARGQEEVTSDIDLLVELPSSVSLLKFVELRERLHEALGRQVDLVEYHMVKPALRARIMQDHIPLL